MNMLTVTPEDAGIRPAGPPDACFYCDRKVGEPHDRECVILVRWVTFNAYDNGGNLILRYRCERPAHWDKRMLEFHANEGTWCTGNMKDDEILILNPTRWEAFRAGAPDGCWCDLTLEVDAVDDEIHKARA